MFSYGEDNKIDFTKINGLTGLFAPNASGKSSLFDAISFCLYDKCSRAFKATNIMNNRKSTFWCQLDFEINGILHSIRREARTVNKGKNVKVDVQFWRIVDGQSESLNGTERRDTNTVIEQYVGRYEDFVLTSLSLQGNNALFIDKSQSERKELLAQFMGLNIFDKLYDAASDDIKEVSVLIKNFKRTDFTSELNDKILEIKENEKIITDLELDITNSNQKRDSLIESIMDLNKQLAKVDAVYDIDKLLSKKEDVLSALTLLEVEKDKKQKQLDELKTLSNDLLNSIKSNQTINGLDINDAKNEFDSCKKEMVSLNHSIQLLKQSIKLNKEKLSHLEKHEYDPNCKYCMNNVFVKDAISTKEKVDAEEINLQNQLEAIEVLKAKYENTKGVETIWTELNETKVKHNKTVSLIEKVEEEIKTLKTL
jgi:exonuclease SbcC